MARPRKYHTEEERRAAQRSYVRKWNATHKEEVRAKRALKDKAAEAAYQREYRARNKARLDEKARQWRLANKERIAAKRLIYKATRRAEISAKQREYYHAVYKGTAGYRAQYTKNNRARPIKDLARNEAALGRKRPDICDACGGNDGGIVFDHCHDKGHARGWLCDRCNVTLGMAKDDIPRLRKLITYLERTKNGTGAQLVISGI